MNQESPTLERASYECPTCKRAFAVTFSPPDERARLSDLLPYATCPGCGERDPVSVRGLQRERRRGRLGMAAFYGVPAALSVFVPLVALVSAAYVLLIAVLMSILARTRRSRVLGGSYLAVVVLLVTSIVVWPRFAFVGPLVMSVWSLVPVSETDGPFERAARLLRIEVTPYRG